MQPGISLAGAHAPRKNYLCNFQATIMESFEQQWKKVEDFLTQRFEKTPDMEAILYLIGINEFGNPDREFTKEQKQDLMHIAVCSLLSQAGYFKLDSHDEDGWPHYIAVKPVPAGGLGEQEQLLKEQIIAYFNLP